MRIAYLLAGFGFLALAVIGVILPVMPTTIFVILAAGAFARSSPRLERRILDHPRFGPMVIRWRESGAIPPRGKAFAAAGMAAGFAIFLITVRPGALAMLAVGAVILACGVFVLTRPDG